LNRVWRLLAGAGAGTGAGNDAVGNDAPSDEAEAAAKLTDAEPTREQARVLHQTIAKVTEDLEAMRFNTAIAALMELTNAAYKWPAVPRAVAENLVLLLAPLAPHIAEELWERLGHTQSLAYHAWPDADPELLKADVLEIPVQVNGKVRGKVEVPADAAEADVIAIARADDNVARYLADRTIRRSIYVRGRIVNFVVADG
jgi:leucyl-tRNA synthetase